MNSYQPDMSSKSDRVKRWRRKAKSRIIEAMGGSCVCCGYAKCQRSMSLHHLDPQQKDMGFGAIRANPKSWPTIVKELRKCVLVCLNCHMEIHDSLKDVPKDAKRFDESFVEFPSFENNNQELMNDCPQCGRLKRNELIFCSQDCAKKSRRKVDWDSIDLKVLYASKSIVQIAEELGCSDVAVHKKLKKLGLK
jgi:hypothetical protein